MFFKGDKSKEERKRNRSYLSSPNPTQTCRLLPSKHASCCPPAIIHLVSSTHVWTSETYVTSSLCDSASANPVDPCTQISRRSKIRELWRSQSTLSQSSTRHFEPWHHKSCTVKSVELSSPHITAGSSGHFGHVPSAITALGILT